jgi:tRNA 2-selenouridine synthase
VALTIDDFFRIREQLAVVDVRSEGEWELGHIPCSVSIPLLNDAERVIVGTTYKQQGQKEAIRQGFRLVGPRLEALVRRAEEVGPEFIVHCWRGGMRSRNFCQFVSMIGLQTHQLDGGYKAYRHAAQRMFTKPFKIVLLTGLTGSGKSELLRALKAEGEQVIDLETLASHKGSVFGGLTMDPQPTTEQFENNLFETLLQLNPDRRVWVEDESIAIGKIFLPTEFWKTMNSAPVVEIEVPKEARIRRLVSEYQNVPPELFQEAMQRITKRLGGQHYNSARELLFAGDLAAAIEIILSYYDKAYANGIDRKRTRITDKVSWDGKDLSTIIRILTRQEVSLQDNIFT